MTIRGELRPENLINARRTILDTIDTNNKDTYTNKQYFFDRKACCIIKDGQDYKLDYDSPDIGTAATKIVFLASYFETCTLNHLKNGRDLLSLSQLGFTIEHFDLEFGPEWPQVYARGVMVSEIETALQRRGIDTSNYDEQQLLDSIDDTTLYRAYFLGVRSIEKFSKGCNALELPHANTIFRGILRETSGSMTAQQFKVLSNQGLHDQMRFMRYFSSLQELSYGSLAEIQATVWEGFQKAEQERAAEIARQLLLEEPEERTVHPPAKKGAKTKRQTTTTTTTTTTTPKRQAPAPTVPKKKSPPVNSAQAQFLDKLNAPVSKTRIQCDKRVLRWRGATLEQIRDTFVDKKGEELVKQYASFTNDELKYQQQVHNIPMERILSIPALQTQYSCPYSFTVNGSQRAGRCFYAIKQNGQATETGLIRVAIDNQTHQIYHILFEKRDNISLDQLIQNVDHTENAVVEDAQWEQPNKYMFKMDEDAIVISIQNLKSKEITIYKISPLS